MSEKLFIITGANRGLGLETTRELAQNPDHLVIMACRDIASAAEQQSHIRNQLGRENVVAKELDLGSLESIRAFVASFESKPFPKISGLVCNAGVSNTSTAPRTIDGFEQTFGVNHLGHFLLTHLLLKSMSESGRVIFVSSDVHKYTTNRGPMVPPRFEKVEFFAYPHLDSNLLPTPEQAAGQAYANSKLCNVMCANEFAHQIRFSELKHVTFNSMNPGLMAGTGLGRHGTGFNRLMWYRILPIMRPLMGKIARSTTQSARDIIHLLTSPDFQKISGRYFDGRNLADASPLAEDPEKRKELWEFSISASRLSPSETILLIGEAV